ncbi:hypothetical protein [Saccharopolyspora griseoalba]|uniref:Uncharacterized protein n=1 Tax=Saccharopolyspora griseoalba TaxID=1431848 RepID=A0ABW2LTI5_9PSEU
MPNKSISVSTPEDEQLWGWAERESKRARFGSMSAFILWLLERERAADAPIDRRANQPQQFSGRTVRVAEVDADDNPTGYGVTISIPTGRFVVESWDNAGGANE